MRNSPKVARMYISIGFCNLKSRSNLIKPVENLLDRVVLEDRYLIYPIGDPAIMSTSAIDN